MKHGRILAAALLLAGAALPLHAQTRIQVGQTVRGSLASSDAVMEDGSHYDPYTLSARAGQSVTITMRSSSFDTYLSVGRVSGGSFQALGSDDDGAGGTDSQVSVTFPSAGEYVIRANSLAADGAGDYTLEVAAGGSGGVSPSPSSGGGVLDMRRRRPRTAAPGCSRGSRPPGAASSPPAPATPRTPPAPSFGSARSEAAVRK
jgi:plastocyanin